MGVEPLSYRRSQGCQAIQSAPFLDDISGNDAFFVWCGSRADDYWGVGSMWITTSESSGNFTLSSRSIFTARVWASTTLMSGAT